VARPRHPITDERIRARSDDPRLATTTAIRVAALRETLRAFLRESELIAQANGLTPQRHLLLLMIKGARDGSERATIMELAARLRLAQTTVSDLVSRAEDVGLIERERSPHDRRLVLLRLTAEGERRLARSVHQHAGERRRLLSMLRALDREEDA
jgi:DNA-binding MarR family transcriptional regulator